MDDKSIEQEIQAKGLTAPRVLLADIEAEIDQDMFLCAIDGRLTICVLRLKNGFLVTGESAATHADNYDQELGKKIARANAVDKVWPLLGFRLRDKLEAQRLHERNNGSHDLQRIGQGGVMCVRCGEDEQTARERACEQR
ncbi:Gp49 family protein [Xanthomonas arboricola]|uniref:Gp49 family protein n=1 Tax=Xanthomonas arboricola TaxID=56448 RepID=UPI003EB9C35D